MDKGNAVDVVYLDISKAFDTFPQHSPGETRYSCLVQVYSSSG